MKDIRLLVMDVDGTLTDGSLNISDNGEVFKTFDVKDGYGIHNLLPQYGILPVIITGRTSKIVERRCRELGIEHIYQGISDKGECLKNVIRDLEITLEQTAGIGDDENDLPMMDLCRLNGCPADAVATVRETCDYICECTGGHGAVREFIQWLIHNQSC